MNNEEIKIIRDTGYGQVKRSVLRDNTLSLDAKAIYAYFCSFAGNSGKAFPLRDTIIKDLGISLKRYYKYLKELQDKNILIIKNTKTKSGLTRNIYYINDSVENKPCSQNDHIPCSQNDHIPCSQNDHIEYNNRIITNNKTYNTIPPTPLSKQEGDREEKNKDNLKNKKTTVYENFEKKFISTWNALPLKNIKVFTKTRQTLLKQRLKEFSQEEIINTLESIKNSPFLLGDNDNNWQATVDWVLKANNFIKLYERNYEKTKTKQSKEKTKGQEINESLERWRKWRKEHGLE